MSQKQMLSRVIIHYMNCSIGSGLTVANPLLGMVALSVATSVSVYKSLVSRSNEMLTERLPYRVAIDRRELRHRSIILPSKKKRLCSQNLKEAGGLRMRLEVMLSVRALFVCVLTIASM